jgi:TonB family protein
MGKIVKYCTVCEEGFAEKFSFCPNCAASLNAFEMKPLVAEEPAEITEPLVAEQPVLETAVHKFEANESFPVAANETVEEDFEPTRPAFLIDDEAELLDLDADIDQIVDEPATVSFNPAPVFPAATVGSIDQAYHLEDTKNVYEPFIADTTSKSDFQPEYKPIINTKYKDDGEFHVAIVEDKGNKMRQLLLLGAFVTVMFLTFAGVIVSLFTNNINIGAINDDSVIAYIPGDAAEIEEEEKPEVKKKDDAGGGGGGGKKDPTPTSQGEFARQVKNPEIPPSAKMDRVTNPELTQVVATQGPENNDKPKDRYGNPNSTYTVASDGTGSGGGQGEGNGRGQGNGNGTGRGNGNGSGIGNGNGNGIGDGTGDGVDGNPPPVKVKTPAPPAVTEAIKILSKPKALYTDAARQNQVQGTVSLRVTFLASGGIGSISPVNGLSNGLTEQAIAAARGIRFEPKKVNGVPQTVTMVVQYSFTLY